jgi:hypothetical protein
MQTIHQNRRGTSLSTWMAVAATCVCGTAVAQDTPAAAMKEEAAKADEPAKTEADYRNWFDVSVGANFISGNKASFKQRHQLPQDVYGGVDEFHYEQDIGQKGLLEIDGRGIFDNEDYSLKLNVEHPDYGFVRGGYREFRTWYDASGIYLPINDGWFDIFDDDTSIDRGELWFEAGLTRPNVPRLTFRYRHQFRDGTKGSTTFGETGRGVTPQRAIVPSFWGIDEERDIFELEGQHTISETDVGLALRYETSDQDNARHARRRPFETQDRFLTQREEVETDLFHARATSQTWLTDTILFTTGYAFTTFDTDIGGTRIYGADYDPIYDPLFARRQPRDEGFFALSGGSKLDQHLGNINLMFSPVENLTIVPALRFEHQDQRGMAELTETIVGTTAPFNTTEEHLRNTSDRGVTDVSEGLEIRYTGLTNWVFYTRGEWLQGEGDMSERQFELHEDLATPTAISRDTDSTRFTQKYVAGANWYPLAGLNFAAQYYYKSRENEYDHPFDATVNTSGNRYPAYIIDQNFRTHDVNFRVTYRPFSKLTLVTRYDYQLSTIDNRMDLLEEVEGAESTAHIIGETITWVPFQRLYLQGSINYVRDRTDTPADDILGPVVQRSENDYINANAMAGYVLTEKTDLQGQYFFYKADNYTDNSAVGVPYNSGDEEHGVTAALIHRFTAAMQWTIKYGFFTSSDQLSGGRNDYEAHMVFSSYRFRF